MRSEHQRKSALLSPCKRGSGNFVVQASCLRGKNRTGERGNALLYVLVAIVLFAALSFTISRQTDTQESANLSDEKVELYAAQLITYASQAKSAVDQMLFTGAFPEDLVFMPPSDANFNSGTLIYKVYHPSGGGLTYGTLPPQAISQNISDPGAGWYMGRFNNVDWTATTGTDVILTAYQITQAACQKINEKITGNTTIPQITDSIKEVFIDDDEYVSGTNVDLTTTGGSPICSSCNNMASLCVQNADGDAYAFYTIVADR